MSRALAVAALAVGAIALNAPVAHAAPLYANCFMNDEGLTGDNHTAAVLGIVATADAPKVSVRCSIRVDGTEVASLDSGWMTRVAVTAGTLGYVATDDQHVEICTEWVESSGPSGSFCRDAGPTEIPPQEVIDLIRDVTSIPDALVCPVLISLAPGIPGVVDIDATGDTDLLGVDFWDCPPYEV